MILMQLATAPGIPLVFLTLPLGIGRRKIDNANDAKPFEVVKHAAHFLGFSSDQRNKVVN